MLEFVPVLTAIEIVGIEEVEIFGQDHGF